MLNIARLVFFAFAALMVVGGVSGYVEKQSIPSLAAGIVCGGLSLAAGILLATRPQLALFLGIAASLLAIGGMAGRIRKAENKVWPSGTVIAAGVLTLLVSVASLASSKNTNLPPTP